MTQFKPNLLVAAILLAASCDSSDGSGTPDGTSGSASETSSSTSTSEPETSSTGDAPLGTSGTSTGGELGTGSASTGAEEGGSSSSSSTAGAGGMEGDVVVEVAYEGELEGALTVALFASCPPAGPPGAFAQEAAPVFPQTIELSGTEFGAGEMPCIIAYVDTGPASPTSPGEEDPTGEVTFEIAAGEPTTVPLTLVDPV